MSPSSAGQPEWKLRGPLWAYMLGRRILGTIRWNHAAATYEDEDGHKLDKKWEKARATVEAAAQKKLDAAATTKTS